MNEFSQFSSVAQPCPTLCNPMNHRVPGFRVHHQLLEFTETHVHWVGDAIQPSQPLSPFSPHLQSIPASGSFPMSQLFASGGQSIGVSASTSVLPMNIQDWFPLGWTGGSPCCPRDSPKSFPRLQFKSISSSKALVTRREFTDGCYRWFFSNSIFSSFNLLSSLSVNWTTLVSRVHTRLWGSGDGPLSCLGKSRQSEFRVMGLCQFCPVYSGSRILKHSDVRFTCGSTVKMVLYNSR